jgi:hypothetical protein
VKEAEKENQKGCSWKKVGMTQVKEMETSVSQFVHTPPNGQNMPGFIRKTNLVMTGGLDKCVVREKEKR